jgi:DNA-binding transcriptional ArsR family regulator
MTSDELSNTFAALADPTRRAILARLANGEATVNELAEPFDLKLPTVSKHLKVLQRAGLIRQSRKAQWRPCRLDPAPLKEVADWVDRYRRIWDERFDQLDAYLTQLQEQEKEATRGHNRKHQASQPTSRRDDPDPEVGPRD